MSSHEPQVVIILPLREFQRVQALIESADKHREKIRTSYQATNRKTWIAPNIKLEDKYRLATPEDPQHEVVTLRIKAQAPSVGFPQPPPLKLNVLPHTTPPPVGLPKLNVLPLPPTPAQVRIWPVGR